MGRVAAAAGWLAAAGVGRAALNYPFDGSWDGWTTVSTDTNQFFALQPPSVSSPIQTSQAGGGFVGLHIPSFGGNPFYYQDSPHRTLWVSSPEFRLDGSGNLTAWLAGGHGYGADATGKLVANVPTNSFDDPANPTFPSFIGVALRNKNTGVFVLASKKTSPGNEWEQVTFTQAQLAALDQNAVYTLDLLDVRQGGWGWVNLDSVSIPGTLVATSPPPELTIERGAATPVRLCWPGAADSFVESSANLTGSWAYAGLVTTNQGGTNTAADLGEPRARFYRVGAAGGSLPRLPVVSVQSNQDGLVLGLAPGFLRLQVYSPRVIRVTYSPTNAWPTGSFAVVTSPAAAGWTVAETLNDVRLATPEVEARVLRSSGAVGFYDRNGQPVLLERPEGGKSLVPTNVAGFATRQSRQEFALEADEAIYGLGQHQQGLLNYRGSAVRLQQSNPGESAVPVLLSSRGYGMLWDNPAVTEVNVDADEEETIPSSQLLTTNGAPGGLSGSYYLGENFGSFAGARTDAHVDFNWTATAPMGLPHDHYSVRWDGFLKARRTGIHTLMLSSDDGVRLWVDGQLVIDSWVTRAAQTEAVALRFAADSGHAIRIEYFQNLYDATVRFFWREPLETPLLTWTSEAADAVDYYFLYGPDLDQAIAGYRLLTGAPPLFGKWAWGFWQSRERYQTQPELLDVAAQYRAAHIPLDGVIQDWQYWPSLNQTSATGGWGSHEFDSTRYPNPAAMMSALHSNHVRALISVWPKFDVTDSGVSIPNLQALEAVQGVYTSVIPYVYPAGQGKWLDPFRAGGRQTYWSQLSSRIFGKGFDGWWLDASEPELGGSWGEFRSLQTAAGPGVKVYNAYPLLHTKAVYEGQRAQTATSRVLILTRSAYAGQQRHAAVAWSGDIQGSWSVFAKQIPAGLNFSASGIPYWNTDIGGFFGGNPADAAYAELFTRWFQFGAFCPMFRVHGTGYPKEMWRFPSATQAVLLEFDRLRYHLLPYIYSVSWMVTDGGYTMMRPLVMDFRGDAAVHDLKDQFLFGPALMACPVTKASATNRSVYLPAGAAWTDFWTGQTNAGGQTIGAAAPIDRMPLFARAGAILPYGPDIEYAMESADPIEVRVYRGADGAFTLYEDEGDTYHYESGIRATIPFAWSEATGTLTIGARSGSFPGMPSTRTFHVVFVSPGHGTGVALTAGPDAVVTYTGSAVSVPAP